MYKIVICIPTYKRQLMLEKLLQSINRSIIDHEYVKEVSIIIADNDVDRSAEKTVDKLKDSQESSFRLHYYNYPEKGLAFVRNKLLKLALDLSPDFIVSCDDDQIVSTQWLNELIINIVTNNGDIALGPVIPIFEKTTPNYIAHWYHRKNFQNNQQVHFFRSGGFIISVKFLIKHKLEFDIRFNTRGGEDSFFGLTALKNGAKIFWARKAIIYETIPENRISLFWILKRAYRGAINFVYILKIEQENIKLLRKTLISTAYIILGLFALVAVLLPIKTRFWGIIKISEGIGGLAGLFNLKYVGY